VWLEVRELVEEYGIDYLVDFSDTTFQDPEWLRALVAAKPASLSPQWHIFARMDEITPETLQLARRLPCEHIFVGVESGDPRRYRAARKGGGSPAEMLEIAHTLRRERIAITPSYVLGLPGEDMNSLQATLEHARQLWEISRFEEVFCCPLIPFPGSLAFSRLRYQMGLQWDLYDVDELKGLWANCFCEVSVQTLQDYAEHILALGAYRITIRRGQDQEQLERGNHPQSAFAPHAESPSVRDRSKDTYSCV
jgi:hypothetical protein